MAGKTTSHDALISSLRNGRLSFPPLCFTDVRTDVAVLGEVAGRIDATLAVRWRRMAFTFAVECAGRSTPRAVEEAIARAKRYAGATGLVPMILVPYLSDSQLERLEGEGVSGIDACGNGLVAIPGALFVLRTGRPNQYPDSASIKNVYRGDTSLVPRVFLLRPVYPTVSAVREEIIRRGGRIALSTVSKALKRLEEDLILARRRGDIRLLQGDKVVQRLASDYRPPKLAGPPLVGRSSLPMDDLWRHVLRICGEEGIRLAVTGRGSVQRYATMAREPIVSVYCTDVGTLFGRLTTNIEVTRRFANLELLETRSETAYFDARPSDEDQVPWASPLQTYLELMEGDKRDRETAGQVISWLHNRSADRDRSASE